MSFNQDLGFGHKGEYIAQKLLSSRHKGVRVSNDPSTGYDLETDLFTVEVKTDRLSINTGNIVVEYMNDRGEPSGIGKSKADRYFIICYDKDWEEIVNGEKQLGWWIGILVHISTVKELAQSEFYRHVWGGDRRASKMTLLPIADIRETEGEIYPIKHVKREKENQDW